MEEFDRVWDQISLSAWDGPPGKSRRRNLDNPLLSLDMAAKFQHVQDMAAKAAATHQQQVTSTQAELQKLQADISLQQALADQEPKHFVWSPVKCIVAT